MRGTALRADAASSVSRILDAAHGALVAGGAASLTRIAEEAGVGAATLYRHFPNRQVLARAVYQRVFTQTVEPLILRLEDCDGDHDSLVHILERVGAVFTRERRLMASVENVGPLTDDLIARHDALFDALARRGQAAGHFRGDLDGRDLARLLCVIALGAGALAEDAEQRHRMIETLLDALRPLPAESPDGVAPGTEDAASALPPHRIAG